MPLEVAQGRAACDQPFAGSFFAALWVPGQWDRTTVSKQGMANRLLETASSQRPALAQKGFKGAVSNELTSVRTGARSDIDDAVGSAHRGGVVLNDQQTVTSAAETFQGVEKTVVVTRMQADGRFVEHVEDTGEGGAELGS